jgi:hypothetical protein
MKQTFCPGGSYVLPSDPNPEKEDEPLIRTTLLSLYALLVSLALPLAAQTRRAVAGEPMGAAVTVAAADQVQLTLGEKAITVANGTPNGGVLLTGAFRRSGGYYFDYADHSDVQDVAASSAPVTFNLPGRIPKDSVWIAVDVASGRSAVLAPEGSQFRSVQPGKDAFTAGSGKLDLDSKFPSLALVRRGVGAWAAGPGDEALARGLGRKLALELSRLRPLHGAPAAPAKLLAHDLVISIDPVTFQYFVFEVAQ